MPSWSWRWPMAWAPARGHLSAPRGHLCPPTGQEGRAAKVIPRAACAEAATRQPRWAGPGEGSGVAEGWEGSWAWQWGRARAESSVVPGPTRSAPFQGRPCDVGSGPGHGRRTRKAARARPPGHPEPADNPTCPHPVPVRLGEPVAGQRLFNHQGLLGGGADHHRQPVWIHLPPLLLAGRLREVSPRQAGGIGSARKGAGASGLGWYQSWWRASPRGEPLWLEVRQGLLDQGGSRGPWWVGPSPPQAQPGLFLCSVQACGVASGAARPRSGPVHGR